MTPGAAEALAKAGQKPSEFVLRHIKLDRGELCRSDHRENLAALGTGLRLFSHFKTAQGDELWVISDAVDTQNGGDTRKRELTTILRPEDY
jgi:hypothetical protein